MTKTASDEQPKKAGGKISAGPQDEEKTFYCPANVKHLLKVIEGIEKGMQPLKEHQLLKADE